MTNFSVKMFHILLEKSKASLKILKRCPNMGEFDLLALSSVRNPQQQPRSWNSETKVHTKYSKDYRSF